MWSTKEVISWVKELNWAIKKLKGESLISKVLMISWNAYIYYVWRERNCRLFKHKEETGANIGAYEDICKAQASWIKEYNI